MKRQLRCKRFIDRQVQGVLVARVGAYWVGCLLGVFAMLVGIGYVSCLLAMDDPPGLLEITSRTWGHFWPAFFSLLMFLPLVIFDFVRWSHRFVGPLLRVREMMRRLADGEPVEPLQFRADDYWTDLAADFNRLVAAAQRIRPSEQERETPVEADEPVGV